MVPLVDTVETFLNIRGNQIFENRFRLASLDMLSFDAPEMNARFFLEMDRLAASSKSNKWIKVPKSPIQICIRALTRSSIYKLRSKVKISDKLLSRKRSLDQIRFMYF